MNKIDGLKPTVVSIIGTRPEAIKFAPILRALNLRSGRLQSRTLITSQHPDLLAPFIASGDLPVDAEAKIARASGGLNEFLSKAVLAIDGELERLRPEFVLVQGDTASTFAGSLAAFNRGISVGHVEAGLRSNSRRDPFPEEMNRRMVTQLADLHFTATERNTNTLLAEGIAASAIVQTGNTIVDQLLHVLRTTAPSNTMAGLLKKLRSSRILTVTCHRRENHGETIRRLLAALRDFVLSRDDVALVFPVHPNPAVRSACAAVFPAHPRIHLLDPLEYPDFVHLLKASWLIASDSGGVQEEAPSLGKPLLVMRATTERPEAVDCGIAKLCGTDADRLRTLLEEAYADGSWVTRIAAQANPFGKGNAADRIVDAVEQRLLAGVKISA